MQSNDTGHGVTMLPSLTSMVKMRDGVEIAVAVYLPEGEGSWPTLFAASPYRYDNNIAPEIPFFLWRETGPIDWYVHEQGYAFVHMDVRGTGNSGGEYGFLSHDEQLDCCEVIAWIAGQPWSTGRIGGTGQSYYAMLQWLVAGHNPPSLTCIAPFDGFSDPYRASIYTGGIPGDFFHLWYNQVMRVVNAAPASGQPRRVDYDLSRAIREHPFYDDFWKERTALERLPQSQVPTLSVGILSKLDLHLNGNILGHHASGGESKLLLLGSQSIYEAVTDYARPEFHARWLLPFYDYYLKGTENGYPETADVRFSVLNSGDVMEAAVWPPEPAEIRTLYLDGAKSETVASLNDGSLVAEPGTGGSTSYAYPDAGWRWGVVGLGDDMRPDPVRRVTSFTSMPLDTDTLVVGPIKLVLNFSSTNDDADVLVKLWEQWEVPGEARPRSRILSKGWLRASHRALDHERSGALSPWHPHDRADPLTPGESCELEIGLMPTSVLLTKGHRLRLEIANGDSPITDQIFTHEYHLFKIGCDTLHHGGAMPSRLMIPVLGQ